MGTTLTGTTPQDTYDSLIKVTDNGPLSGTAKYLSDGLGNDSILALSTSQVGIGTATPTYSLQVKGSGDTTIGIEGGASGLSSLNLGNTANLADGGIRYDNATDALILRANNAERLRITSAGNVGIGTSAPTSKLTSIKTITTSYGATGNAALSLSGADSSTKANLINFGYDGETQQPAYIGYLCTSGAGSTRGDLVFATRSGTSDTAPAERVRITADGLTFNGDTAAANALDDYEEGTFTASITFGGGSTGITYASRTATYTKIGRQVTVNGLIELSNKGTSTGAAKIEGLPFNISGGSFGNYSAPTLRPAYISFSDVFIAYGEIGQNTIALQEITTAGLFDNLDNTNFANDSSIIISFTYFV